MKNYVQKTAKVMIAMAMTSVLCVSCGSSKSIEKSEESIDQKYARANSRNFDVKYKEVQKAGWRIDDSYKTLELAMLEHHRKMRKDGVYTIESEVSMCRSLNVCRANALNNALREYADLAGGVIKGKAVNDIKNNASAMKPEEFDNFYAAYVRNIKAEVKGALSLSYALVRPNGTGKSYKQIYIVDENAAGNARKRAMQRALEETKLSVEHGLWIEKFVNENPIKK